MGTSLPKPAHVEPQTIEEIIEEAQTKLRRSLEENTEFNNLNNLPPSLRNLRSGIPEEEIIRRAQDRFAVEIAKAETAQSPTIKLQLPISVAKTILMVLTFFVTFFSLPFRFISTIIGIIKAKLNPQRQNLSNWGRTPSMVEEGRFGSRANQISNW